MSDPRAGHTGEPAHGDGRGTHEEVAVVRRIEREGVRPSGPSCRRKRPFDRLQLPRGRYQDGGKLDVAAKGFRTETGLALF